MLWFVRELENGFCNRDIDLQAIAKNNPRLSICIATYNRGQFIGETLDSILGQMEPGVELIVVDGASPDNTPDVMAQYLSRHPEIRYYREQENSGVDCDYDKAVGYANGDYCWVFPDDDLLKPGAIKRVLDACRQRFVCVLVDAEVCSPDFSKQLLRKRLEYEKDQVYKPKDFRKLFVDTVNKLSFIGSVVMRRDVWLDRERQAYYGSFFVHVGVIFQTPLPGDTLVIAEPQISIRYGNSSWTSRSFEIWMFKWPQVIWSLKSVLDIDKKKIVSPEPWRDFKNLILLRAKGAYTFSEYEKFLKHKVSGKMEAPFFWFLSVVPGKFVNLIACLYVIIFVKAKAFTLADLRSSPFYFMGLGKSSRTDI
ncbi:MAG: glycosyltransferase [Proteobacteria bacterium]|nr:glycosyltransferase [Bacteroidota bacterium]MBU1569948.1 glycosyltransferase [Pseudomonadota bacterium]